MFASRGHSALGHKVGISGDIHKECVFENALSKEKQEHQGIQASPLTWEPGEMAVLSSPGSGPCFPQGIPEVNLFGCQVSSQEISGIFRKQRAEDRPGQLGATTAIDNLGHTQTTQRGENL